MPRVIDTMPMPALVREKKLIVTSKSRTGTFSLYQALKMLGYRPYHFYEVMSGGPTEMTILEDALKAKYQGVGKLYGKAEFDKWFADYDAIIEVTPFLLEEIVACYPDAKFLHTERDVDAWYQSMNNTAGPLFADVGKFPLKEMRTIDNFVDKFCSLHLTLKWAWCRDKPWVEGEQYCKDGYIEMNRKVRELIPQDRLAVFKLEEGFGWEQICPFLEKSIPDVPYPRGNAPAEFHQLAKSILGPAFKKSIALVVTSVLVPALGVGLWYYRKRG